MKIGSLFTGYGGLDLAVEQHVNGSLEWYAEIEPAACKILEELHPGVPNLGDVTKIDWSTVPPVDVITGGYPCQPFSHAGNRKGKNDERHLWPYVRDAIRTIRPRYAILENVSGHVTLGFADVLADLAEIGWSCEWGTYRASDVGAPHRRERIFIVAHADSQGSQGHDSGSGETSTRGHRHVKQGTSAPTPDTSGHGHGQQLHARGMAGVEGQTEGDTQQRQRARRESDAGSTITTPNTEHDGSHGGDVAGSLGASKKQRRLQQPERCDSNIAADTESERLQRREFAAKDYERKLAGRRTTSQRNCDAANTDNGHWGKYAPAIRRWESVLGRNAPDPVVMRSDKRRLNPRFVEWMMGLPDGWVTGHGLSAAKELKMLGNGVVPQQARVAVAQLMERIPV